jgi:hypothetical protein
MGRLSLVAKPNSRPDSLKWASASHFRRAGSANFGKAGKSGRKRSGDDCAVKSDQDTTTTLLVVALQCPTAKKTELRKGIV